MRQVQEKAQQLIPYSWEVLIVWLMFESQTTPGHLSEKWSTASRILA